MAYAFSTVASDNLAPCFIEELSAVFRELGRALPKRAADTKTQAYIESIKGRCHSLGKLEYLRRYNRHR